MHFQYPRRISPYPDAVMKDPFYWVFESHCQLRASEIRSGLIRLFFNNSTSFIVAASSLYLSMYAGSADKEEMVPSFWSWELSRALGRVLAIAELSQQQLWDHYPSAYAQPVETLARSESQIILAFDSGPKGGIKDLTIALLAAKLNYVNFPAMKPRSSLLRWARFCGPIGRLNQRFQTTKSQICSYKNWLNGLPRGNFRGKQVMKFR